MQSSKSLASEHVLKQVYAILVVACGAKSDSDAEQAFVAEFQKEQPTSEYRFQGGLGFGGKFRFPACTVDCYPEDVNPKRKAMMDETNKQLAELTASAE